MTLKSKQSPWQDSVCVDANSNSMSTQISHLGLVHLQHPRIFIGSLSEIEKYFNRNALNIRTPSYLGSPLTLSWTDSDCGSHNTNTTPADKTFPNSSIQSPFQLAFTNSEGFFFYGGFSHLKGKKKPNHFVIITREQGAVYPVVDYLWSKLVFVVSDNWPTNHTAARGISYLSLWLLMVRIVWNRNHTLLFQTSWIYLEMMILLL